LKRRNVVFFDDIEIELPSYMHSLPQEELDFIKRTYAEDTILACGYHAKTNKLIYIDSSKNILEVQLESLFKQRFSILSAAPINTGKRVEFHLSDAIVEVDSTDLFSMSESIDLSQFCIDM